MGEKIPKVKIAKLKDEEIYKLVYEEYMRIKPNSEKEFYEKSCLPTAEALRKRLKMKYADILVRAGIPLELLNVRKSDDYHLDRLKKLAEMLGHTPSSQELLKAGIYKQIYFKRFGSFEKALQLIGVEYRAFSWEKKKIDKNKIIRDYKELSTRLGRPATQKDFTDADLGYSLRIVRLRVGCFGNLRELAGYKRENRGGNNRIYNKSMTLDMLAKLFIENNGPLSKNQIKANKKLPSISTITETFHTTRFEDIWKVVSLRAIEMLKNQDVKVNTNTNEKIMIAGKKGERNVAHNLNFLNKEEYIVFNDINIYSDVNKLSQQIDHLVIGVNGVFCIETKSINGEIIIKSNGTWEKYCGGNMDVIPDPTQQIIRHENQLKSILKDNVEINSLIVLGNYKTKVKNENLSKYPIVNVNQLLEYIQNYQSDIKLNKKQINNIRQIINTYTVSEKMCMGY